MYGRRRDFGRLHPARSGRMILHWHLLRLWVLISLAALLAGVLLAPAPTLADDQLNHAGLIVRDAESRMTYAWVPFEEEEITGIELLRRSGIPVVTVGFGALGEGVCSIGGQGCGVAECRRNVCQVSSANAPYWQYFKQDPADPAGWIGCHLAPVAAKSRTAMSSAGAGRLVIPGCRCSRRQRSQVLPAQKIG